MVSHRGGVQCCYQCVSSMSEGWSVFTNNPQLYLFDIHCKSNMCCNLFRNKKNIQKSHFFERFSKDQYSDCFGAKG